ncbi:eukaryotic translation initiation factor 2c [Apiospora arundinis]
MGSDKKRVSSGGQGSSEMDDMESRIANMKVEDSEGGNSKEGGNPKKKELSPEEQVGKRVDLPIQAYLRGKSGAKFTARPEKGNARVTLSKNTTLVNVFKVTGFPTKTVYQYDISVRKKNPAANDGEALDPLPRGLAAKLWAASSSQRNQPEGIHWIYNGLNIAWSSPKMAMTNNEKEIEVDLDPNSKRDEVFILVVKYTTNVNMFALKKYLEGGVDWSEDVTRCMSAADFLDHTLRQTPSQTHLLIGRNFFPRTGTTVSSLDNLIEIVKGGFASFRISRIPGEQKGGGLVVNVDVANTAFWKARNLSDIVDLIIGPNNTLAKLRPTTSGQTVLEPTGFKSLRRLVGLKFKVVIPGRAAGTQAGTQGPSTHTIKRFYFLPKKFPTGADAKNATFSKIVDGKQKNITVFNHFRDTHQYTIRKDQYPLVETTKGSLFPLEVCELLPMQRFRQKLDPDQMSAMIRIAVGPALARKTDVEEIVSTLNWARDSVLRAFDIQINATMLSSTPQTLVPASISYQNGVFRSADASNLIGKKFLSFRKTETAAFVNLSSCNQTDLEKYWTKIQTAFRGHTDDNDDPIKKVVYTTLNKLEGLGENHNYAIVFVLINRKTTDQYNEIKRLLDCTVKVPSQVIVHFKGKKFLYKEDAFWSNICLKVNAKLGSTAYTSSESFPYPTMIVGLDVSHAAPGSEEQSMAAMSVSLDRCAAFYGGSCQTNGVRKEIVEYSVMKDLLDDLLKHWATVFGPAPQNLLFFRDGVSDGQFQQVNDTEVSAIKKVFTDNGFEAPKISVIVATKRHHIRTFVQNKNRKPHSNKPDEKDPWINSTAGTMIEDLATDFQNWDFYLYSHKAIQGTSRPVHYHVIKDEISLGRQYLPNLINRHCYQYCRCPTPVSLHPAIYYAHLISRRARSHVADTIVAGDDRLKVKPIGDLRKVMWFA